MNVCRTFSENDAIEIRRQMESRTPLQAKEYRLRSEEKNRQIIDQFARAFLEKLVARPYVAIHGDCWLHRFKIQKRDDIFEAIQKIYSCLHETTIQGKDSFQKLNTRLRFDEFNQLYLSNLSKRENQFCERLDIKKDAVSLEEWLPKLAEKFKQEKKEQLLWKASAEANYWEAIPVLLNHMPIKGIPLMNIRFGKNNLDWVAAFNEEMKKRKDIFRITLLPTEPRRLISAFS